MIKIILPSEQLLAASWRQGFLWGAVAVLLLVALALLFRGKK